MQTTQTALVLETAPAMTALGKLIESAAPAKVAKPVTAAKPKAAAKASAKAVEAKAATKPAAKKGAATKGAPKAAKGLNFTLMTRPSSGALLYAFTSAVLSVSGLAKGGAVNKAQLTKTIGATAIRYHLDKGTFAVNDKGAVVLTAGGKAFFALRVGKFDDAVAEAYATLIQTGEINDLVCKNKDFVTKVA